MSEFSASELESLEAIKDDEEYVPQWSRDLEEHYRLGNHWFCDLDFSYFTDTDAERFECVICGMFAWEVSNFGESLEDGRIVLWGPELDYLRQNQSTHEETVAALIHIGKPEHKWQLATSEQGAPCSICKVTTGEATLLGDVDVLNLPYVALLTDRERDQERIKKGNDWDAEFSQD